MKRAFVAILLVASFFVGCSEKTLSPDGKDEGIRTEWRDSYNGQLLLLLSDAYKKWDVTGSMPGYIVWDAVKVEAPAYLRGAIALFVKMLDNPDDWWVDDISYPSSTVTLAYGGTELPEPRVVKFSDLETVVREQYAKMMAGEELDNRYTLGASQPQLRSNGLRVMLCRAFAAYDAEGKFPETIDSWESTFTISTTNCDTSAPEVKEARDAAWAVAHVTESSTPREKAVAIFNYARDKWAWEDYYNTKKGAVGTIKAKAGNCCDLSHAVCAMARLSGLPARYFHAQCHYSSGYIGHVISQIYIDGTWYYADASNNGNAFGSVSFSDYTGLHIYETLPF